MQSTDATTPKRLTKKQKQTPIKIWSFSIDNFNYSDYELAKSADRDFFKEICIPKIMKGEPVGELWKPLIFLEKTQKQHTDFAFIENIGIAMSQKAVDALSPFIRNTTEILPLKTLPDNPFFFVNALNPLDALDEEKSIFEYSVVTKTKIGVEKFVFDSEKIENKHFFKIKGFWYFRCISDEFRSVCRKHKLKGFDCRNMLWKQN